MYDYGSGDGFQLQEIEPPTFEKQETEKPKKKVGIFLMSHSSSIANKLNLSVPAVVVNNIFLQLIEF